MAKDTIRFVVVVKGKQRVLLSAQQKKDGDVLLFFKSADNYENTDIGILEQRYSIHQSPLSKNSSTIKHTLKLANKKEITTVNYTEAIKAGRGFCPIFFKFCNNLQNTNHDLNPKRTKELIILGKSDERFSFYFGVILSASNVVLPSSADNNINVHELILGNIRISILSCLTALPPHRFSRITHALIPSNLNDDIAQEWHESLRKPNSVESCYKLFYQSGLNMRHVIIQEIARDIPEFRNQLYVLDQLPLTAVEPL